MAAADYRLMTEATGQRIAIALENLAGFGAYLTTSDVVNDLTNNDPTKVASQQEIYELNNRTNNFQSINLTGSYTNIGDAWDAITVYGKIVVGTYASGGIYMFMCYKYADSQNGMMWAQKYSDWEMTILSVNSGTKHISKVALQS